MTNTSTPHLEKLVAALNNDKLPESDRPSLLKAVDRYHKWIAELRAATGSPDEILARRVRLLNDYRNFLDLEVIFDSPDEFLYRQKGQLKLDNSVIEEFLPWIMRADIVPSLPADAAVGPTNCFAAVYFASTPTEVQTGGGLRVRTKAQDFAISRRLFLNASHEPGMAQRSVTETHVAYVACEIKTNLDKTMFQEACATARDLKVAVPAARYYLMAEWLDMTPVSTASTDIESVFLLRKAKRLASNVRKNYSNPASRRQVRSEYADHLERNPFRPEVFRIWLENVASVLTDAPPAERSVLEQGYF